MEREEAPRPTPESSLAPITRCITTRATRRTEETARSPSRTFPRQPDRSARSIASERPSPGPMADAADRVEEDGDPPADLAGLHPAEGLVEVGHDDRGVEREAAEPGRQGDPGQEPEGEAADGSQRPGPQTSRISADFFSAMSLTLASNRLVRDWISSLHFSTSSSVRILSVSSLSADLLASRRMFRIEIRASSARSLTRATSFLRCSTESEGTFRRMTLLSELGVRPRSLAWIALTMSPMAVWSNGRIRIC